MKQHTYRIIVISIKTSFNLFQKYYFLDSSNELDMKVYALKPELGRQDLYVKGQPGLHSKPYTLKKKK